MNAEKAVFSGKSVKKSVYICVYPWPFIFFRQPQSFPLIFAKKVQFLKFFINL